MFRNLPCPDTVFQDDLVELEDVEEEIEELVDKRVMPFGVQYLVKWARYDWSHNTWSHEADLPSELVQIYELSRGAEKKGKRTLRSTCRTSSGTFKFLQ